MSLVDNLMTFEEGAAFTPSSNGHDDLFPKPEGAHLDTERGVFVDSAGNEWELLRISRVVLERLYSQSVGKPKEPPVPMIETRIGKGQHVSLEPNPNDEAYKAAMEAYADELKTWEMEKGVRIMMYLFIRGVKGQPPDEFVNEHSLYFPQSDANEMKYLWINTLMPEDDIEAFIEAVTGLTMPTPKGLTEAENFTT